MIYLHSNHFAVHHTNDKYQDTVLYHCDNQCVVRLLQFPLSIYPSAHETIVSKFVFLYSSECFQKKRSTVVG
jgi:hypothetical protein